jgi:hypothetical protein
MAVYDSVPGTRPNRHLKDREFDWFDFDPTPIVNFIRAAKRGPHEGLAARMAIIQTAAWKCESILRFTHGRVSETTVYDVSDDFEELLFQLDAEGNPVGIEFATHDCTVP